MSTEPPKTHRYRIVGGLPTVLEYRNGRVKVFRGTFDDAWMVCAMKENDPSCLMELVRRPLLAELGKAMSTGFAVEADSPADKIMRRLVRSGHAVLLRPGELFRHVREPRQEPYH